MKCNADSAHACAHLAYAESAHAKSAHAESAHAESAHASVCLHPRQLPLAVGQGLDRWASWQPQNQRGNRSLPRGFRKAMNPAMSFCIANRRVKANKEILVERCAKPASVPQNHSCRGRPRMRRRRTSRSGSNLEHYLADAPATFIERVCRLKR